MQNSLSSSAEQTFPDLKGSVIAGNIVECIFGIASTWTMVKIKLSISSGVLLGLQKLAGLAQDSNYANEIIPSNPGFTR